MQGSRQETESNLEHDHECFSSQKRLTARARSRLVPDVMQSMATARAVATSRRATRTHNAQESKSRACIGETAILQCVLQGGKKVATARVSLRKQTNSGGNKRSYLPESVQWAKCEICFELRIDFCAPCRLILRSLLLVRARAPLGI